MADPDTPDRPLVITERDMLGALQVLERASEDPDVLIVLSDEEILALDGPDSLRALGSPFLDQDHIDRDTASATALRGLIARRMVNPTDQAREPEGEILVGEGDPVSRLLQLERGLAGVLLLRRIPEEMLIIERVASDVRTRLGLYAFPDGVLEEFVAADGFHHFCAPSRDVLTDRVADFVDPHGTAAEDGEVEEVAVSRIDALEGIEDVRVFSTLTRIGASGARRASVLVLTDRVRVLDNGDGDPADLPVDALLPVSDVSGTSLREILGALLPEAPDRDPDEASSSPSPSPGRAPAPNQ